MYEHIEIKTLHCQTLRHNFCFKCALPKKQTMMRILKSVRSHWQPKNNCCWGATAGKKGGRPIPEWLDSWSCEPIKQIRRWFILVTVTGLHQAVFYNSGSSKLIKQNSRRSKVETGWNVVRLSSLANGMPSLTESGTNFAISLTSSTHCQWKLLEGAL